MKTMSQTDRQFTTESNAVEERSTAVYDLIAVLHELDAIGDATGVTQRRLEIHPDLSSVRIPDVLDELYADGIVQRVTFVPTQDQAHRNRCETARIPWDREPRYRLRSKTQK